MLDQVTRDKVERRKWLDKESKTTFAATADRFRKELIGLLGEEQGKRVRYAEAFELCEYGRQPSAVELRTLFPITGAK